MYFSQFQWVSIDLKQQFGRKYPCIFNAESECRQRTCGRQPDLAWDDLWIVIPMFRTWEWWAMADWSTAFHSQNDTDPNDPNRFQYLSLFPYPLTMHQVLYYDSTCVVHECFFPFAPGILQAYEAFKSPWTIFKLQHETDQNYPCISRNKQWQIWSYLHVSKKHVSQPETAHRTVEVMGTTVPNITQAQRICSQLPNLTPRTTPKYLVYPCLSYHTFAQHPTGNWQELRFKHQQFKEVNVDSTRFQDIYGYFRDARTASMHYHHYHYLWLSCSMRTHKDTGAWVDTRSCPNLRMPKLRGTPEHQMVATWNS